MIKKRETKSRTIGETYGPAMEIQTQKEADAYFQTLVDECVTKFGKTRAEAESIQKQNLGYYAGYYDNETRERVERLFHCSHPIFGSIAANGSPSPEKAFAMVVKAGKSMREKPRKGRVIDLEG